MIIFLDLETTGLDPLKGSILEIAMIATDDKLVQIGEPFVSLVKPIHLRGIEVMDDFVRDMHAKNGLLDQLYVTEEHLRVGEWMLRDNLPRLGDVERDAIEWLTKIWFLDVPRTSDREPMAKWSRSIPLGGNTVHFDKRWLIHHMDEFEALFSYRIVDVSSFTEECKRVAPSIYARRPGLGPDGKPVKAHRALDDIRMSIETLKFYRENWFINDEWANHSEMKSNG